MADDQTSGEMKNPYEERQEEETFVLSRRSMWVLVVLFVLVCLNPPLYRNVYETVKPEEPRWVPVIEIFKKGKDEKGNDLSLLAHLRKYENRLEDAEFTKPPRRVVQKGLTGIFGAGNRKTVIGKDGWLYFQPALDAVTGYGPLKPEPDSVAKDPNREPWNGPGEVIGRFARQLDEMGVELVFVPLPVKPMIYPEFVAGGEFDRPAEHADAAAFYAGLEALPNVTVINLAQAFWDRKAEFQVFLKQDTHWTPKAMELAARLVASGMEKGGTGTDPGSPEQRSSIGDLVEKLDVLPETDPAVPQAGFDLETVAVTPVAAEFDDSAPVVLLGDSFVNIYSKTGDLHWGEGAGFGEHLARELGMPIEVIAINGQAATGVRRRLAERHPVSEMKRKKAVIWAVAARDLFMSETPARENDVQWEDVVFRESDGKPSEGKESGKPGPVVVEGKVTFKSGFPDPNSVTYKDALFAVEYEITGVPEGEGFSVGDKVVVMHWAFVARVLQPPTSLEVGQSRVLHLVPFETKKKLQTAQASNDTDEFLAFWWDEEKEPEKSGESASSARLMASGVCVLVSLAFIGILAMAVRRAGRA